MQTQIATAAAAIGEAVHVILDRDQPGVDLDRAEIAERHPQCALCARLLL
jgi:hypothetical protein